MVDKQHIGVKIKQTSTGPGEFIIAKCTWRQMESSIVNNDGKITDDDRNRYVVDNYSDFIKMACTNISAIKEEPDVALPCTRIQVITCELLSPEHGRHL